jgi:putative ABC transport system substrate-binding protein
MPLIGMLINGAEGDRERSSQKKEAFLQGLGPMPDLHIAARFGSAVYSSYLQKAGELVKLTPDLYFASCYPSRQALIQTAPGPIVFAGIFDSPHYALSRSNIYGFTSYGTDLVIQWPGLLKQIAPNVTKAAVIYDKDSGRIALPHMYQSIRDATRQADMNVSEIDARLNESALEDAVANFKNSGGVGGLIVLGSTLTGVHRQTIIRLAEIYKLPAVYPNRLYVTLGGLISRGVKTQELYRRAGDYAKQILNGTPPADKIVSNANYETVVNRSTAEALGLTGWSTIKADLITE